MTQLNVEWKSRSVALARLLSSKDESIKYCIMTQDILTARANNKGLVQPLEGAFFTPRDTARTLDKFIVNFQHHWYLLNRRGQVLKCLSVLCGILSVIIIVIEGLFLFGDFHTNEAHQFIFDTVDESFVMFNFVFTIPLAYMFAATFYGMFNFKMIEIMAVHWDGNTDPFSLLQSVINLWRLAVPAVYNALQILAIKNCSFFKVMGQVREVPVIGQSLHKFVFPACLCLMVLLTATGLLRRMARCFG